jgi:hypothetical protein
VSGPGTGRPAGGPGPDAVPPPAAGDRAADRRSRRGHHRRWLGGAALVVLVAVFYGPLLDRGFTSEDFLLLRVLRQSPPWGDLGALLAGPWLGIEVVRFYRPLALLLLAVEAHLFGGRPLPYNAVHLALHAVNVLLVHRLAGRLFAAAAAAPAGGVRPSAWAGTASPPAFVAALLFALHPLHPNAVSWIGSYATLFAGTALLAAAVQWEAWRGGEDLAAARAGSSGGAGLAAVPAPRTPSTAARLAAPPGRLLAAVLFVAALLCYEAAVVLPAVLLLRELLLPAGRRPAGAVPPAARRRLLATLPFIAAAALYLLLRAALFGQVVGGYGSFAARLAPAALGRLAADAVTSLHRLFLPAFGGAAAPWGLLALGAAGPLLVGLLRPPAPRRQVGLWLFGWAWAIAFLAPFAFQPFVPASGRFAYLASVGAALALGQVAGLGLSAVSAWREGRREEGRPEEARTAPWRAVVGALAVVLVTALAVHWAARLVGMAGVMERAGAVAAGVRGELAEVASQTPPGPLLVAGHPRFLTDAAGVPLAQVLRYGLADSLEPPFVAGEGAAARGVLVYPLPEGPGEGAVAAWRASGRDVTFAAWDEAAGEFRALEDGAGRGLLGRGTASYEENFGGGLASASARRHRRRTPADMALGALQTSPPEEPPPGPSPDGADGTKASIPLPRGSVPAQHQGPRLATAVRPSPSLPLLRGLEMSGWEVRYEPWAGAERYRLVVLTRGNPAVVEGMGGVVVVPETFVRSMRHLYSGPVFWWLEAWGPGGELLAVSRARTLPER